MYGVRHGLITIDEIDLTRRRRRHPQPSRDHQAADRRERRPGRLAGRPAGPQRSLGLPELVRRKARNQI
jgi:hypothetical protein